MTGERVWAGRKPACGCLVYASLASEHRHRPVVRLGKIVRKKWVDGKGLLHMENVRAEEAQVMICRCGS